MLWKACKSRFIKSICLMTHKIFILKVDKCYSLTISINYKIPSTLKVEPSPSKLSLSLGYVSTKPSVISVLCLLLLYPPKGLVDPSVRLPHPWFSLLSSKTEIKEPFDNQNRVLNAQMSSLELRQLMEHLLPTFDYTVKSTFKMITIIKTCVAAYKHWPHFRITGRNQDRK